MLERGWRRARLFGSRCCGLAKAPALRETDTCGGHCRGRRGSLSVIVHLLRQPLVLALAAGPSRFRGAFRWCSSRFGHGPARAQYRQDVRTFGLHGRIPKLATRRGSSSGIIAELVQLLPNFAWPKGRREPTPPTPWVKVEE